VGGIAVEECPDVRTSKGEANVRILLLCSAFNGLSQRVWCALRDAGHQVGVLPATSERDIVEGVRAAGPDLIIAPYLTDRVPAAVWRHWRTVILHPGPVGDELPVSSATAARLGLVDEVGPRHPEAYGRWLTDPAERHGDVTRSRRRRAAKVKRPAADAGPLVTARQRPADSGPAGAALRPAVPVTA
jgi:hypothetical protein